MKRPSRATVGVAAIGTVLAVTMSTGNAGAAATAAAVNPNTDGPVAAGVDSSSAMVVLSGDPLTASPGTRNAKGRVDMTKKDTKSAQAKLAAARNDFKRWLRANAPGVTVTGEHDLALNAVTVKLNGTPLSVLQKAPGVVAAQYDLLYHPLGDPVPAKGQFDAAHPDLSLIHAVDAWGSTDPLNVGLRPDGTRVKVAIVDTGIDISNPCFSDDGYAAAQQLGDKTFTNNKVIVAKVFTNRHDPKGPSKDTFTPEAVQDHGTHVAGTVACDLGKPVSVDGVPTDYPLWGVAPGAQLGNYNVFPGTDATGITNARSEDILNALEAAYSDGMDVANMSLGGDTHGIQDLLAMGVDNLTSAGMVIAVAAGNSGPGVFTTESPGSAQGALTAGASTVPHFIATEVTLDAFPGSAFEAASGDFNTVNANLTGTLVDITTSGLDTASQPLPSLPALSVPGIQIAVISRGACTFSTKIRNAQDAGADAVLVVNSVAGPPVAMASDGTPNQPTVPAYMLPLDATDALLKADDTPATIHLPKYITQPDQANIMAGFSSVGPVDVSYRIKPDAVAPGVNVLSSIPHQFCDSPPCFAFFQGTSMATPHLAGSAAVLLWQHPEWTPLDVESAIANTAERDVLRTADASGYVIGQHDSVQIQGGGLENLAAATGAQVTLNPVSLSFGAVPHGSGKAQSQTVTVTNHSSAAVTVVPSVPNPVTQPGVSFAVSASPVAIPAGGSATITVTASNDKQAGFGPSSAYLVLSSSDGTEIAHAALFEMIK